MLDLKWFSKAEDVLNLESALKSVASNKTFELGEGGTTLRFFSIYLSSFSGEWVLKCKESLLKRPQTELFSALKALGAELKQTDSKTLILKSVGWKKKEIKIEMKDSTQILTGLVLAALSRGLPLKVKLKNVGQNSDYFNMTLAFVETLGFSISLIEDFVDVPPKQKILNSQKSLIEPDWSSAAFLMVLGALKKDLCVEGLNAQSLQPDAVIRTVLSEIGADTILEGCVKPGELPYSGFTFNVQKCPDLFPVLSVLACFCKGKSKIYGAPQLKSKESNRIDQMHNILSLCGYKNEVLDDGMLIEGCGLEILKDSSFDFDVSKDHRLYMATEILSAMGYRVKALGSDSILKSFAEYKELKKGALSCFF